MSDDRVTWFGTTNGRVTGVIGLIAAVAVVAVAASDGSVPGILAGVLVGLVSWLVLLRPRVGLRGTDLLLRGIVSTITVPLASIDGVTIRQVLAVWVDGRRYVNAAVGRTFREINRQRRAGGQVEEIPARESKYADHVQDLITERAREARRDGAPMGPVRREWAWLEAGVLVVLLAALLLALGL